MSLKTESEKQNSISFLPVQVICEINHLPIPSSLNLLIVAFIHISTAFYHLAISLVLFTHSLIDAFDGLNYTLN